MKERLYPINRSITGDGVRESLKILQETADFDIKEIPTGTKVFDWEVPKEWNIKGAKLEDKNGVIADLKETNLRVVGYSRPINQDLSFDQVKPHIHTDPLHPNAIPYRTSYYKENWGFCLTEGEKKKLNKDETYHVEIDSTLENGGMTYGERILQGKTEKEYLISTYSCHPSMYNDNISGMLVWANVLKEMQDMKLNNTYHFFIGPETLGVLSLLQRKKQANGMLQRGDFNGAIVINCVGRNDEFVLKNSFLGNSEMDLVAEQTFKEMGIYKDPPKNPNGPIKRYTTTPFDVNGSDERQLQSQAFKIPTINITRGPYYGTNWYHNSNDVYRDKSKFISFGEADLKESTQLYLNLIMNLDMNKTYQINPKYMYGEPMLGKHDLYPTTSGNNQLDKTSTIAKWVMHQGYGDLVKIAQKSNATMKEVYDVCEKMQKGGLVK